MLGRLSTCPLNAWRGGGWTKRRLRPWVASADHAASTTSNMRGFSSEFCFCAALARSSCPRATARVVFVCSNSERFAPISEVSAHCVGRGSRISTKGGAPTLAFSRDEVVSVTPTTWHDQQRRMSAQMRGTASLYGTRDTLRGEHLDNRSWLVFVRDVFT